MKKLLSLSVSLLLLLAESKAQYTSIPDTNFRNYLQQLYPACFNAAGQIDTTCSSIINEDSLVIRNNNLISDLSGLKYFTNLRYVNCDSTAINNIPQFPDSVLYISCSALTQLLTLPALPGSLRYLNISGCYQLSDFASASLPDSLRNLDCSDIYQLNYLPPLPSELDSLNCSNCSLFALPPLPASLEYLNCYRNQIWNIPSLPVGLKYFYCGRNSFSFSNPLPPLPANLLTFDCRENIATTLPALPASLTTLHCPEMSVVSLPALPAGLRSLDCSSNPLTTLPPLPAGLVLLNCSATSIISFPPLPGSLLELNFQACVYLQTFPVLPNTLQILTCAYSRLHNLPGLPDSLKFLNCSNDSLTYLPDLPPSLKYLICSGNQLTSLPKLNSSLIYLDCIFNNIYCLPHIPSQSGGDSIVLRFDANKIKCIPNLNPGVKIKAINQNYQTITRIPLCNPTNNINNCRAFPVIAGTVFNDNNSNGTKDADEPFRSGMKISLSNNNFSFSNSNGYFEIAVDSTGNYTDSLHHPPYFNSIPPTHNYTFSSYDTLVTGSFALQANTLKDSLSIHIISITARARPGFSFQYFISYENTGTTALSADIVFNYDNTRLTYNSSSNAAIINNGTNLSFNTGNLMPGEQKSFIAYFTVKPTALIGDSISAKATITSNLTTATDSVAIIIRGSFDPNDKQATTQLSPSQISSKKPIDYKIRFQNTGTDTAFNIIITDTLDDNNLDLSTFQVTASSHTCKTTIKNGIAYFEFLDILLPDKNINEPLSHGFINFKVGVKQETAVNTFIDNKAAIYFDYNVPIITNTTSTVIKNPGLIFTFNGNGNWTVTANWSDSIAPPPYILQNEMIIIDPATNGQCRLNTPFTVLPGASILIKKGKKLFIPGDLLIQSP